MTTLDREEKEIREVLSDTIQPDGSLHNLGWYINWHPEDENITIDALLTLEELKAITWWVKHKGEKKK